MKVVVPEIADYELRRELLRLGNSSAVARLNAFINAYPDRYLPLTTVSLRRAAELWADVRRRGMPTADPQALDGDVILAAQAITSSFPLADIVVATTNPIHISRFISAALWTAIS